jgi:N-acetylglucosamine kinase-like BadF-type ATPase
MQRADSGRPQGELGSRLLAACRASDTVQLLGRLNGLREPMEWAGLAHVVFEAADLGPAAQSVVLRCASALSDQAKSVQASLGIDGPVILAGGLLLNQPKLECTVREQLEARCIRLEEPPVAGAVRIAELELRS